LILLAESANRTKQGGQELIGGLDVRVNRNHFGRQAESFMTDLTLPFLSDLDEYLENANSPFQCIFIRAPIVERVLPYVEGEQKGEMSRKDTVVAPSRKVEKIEAGKATSRDVEVLAVLPDQGPHCGKASSPVDVTAESSNIVAVRQGNVFGTSFHPELTGDVRIHVWWLLRLMQSTRELQTHPADERHA
jgi:pyridoxal 5'-phosphate synthase pdxT subunit